MIMVAAGQVFLNCFSIPLIARGLNRYNSEISQTESPEQIICNVGNVPGRLKKQKGLQHVP